MPASIRPANKIGAKAQDIVVRNISVRLASFPELHVASCAPLIAYASGDETGIVNVIIMPDLYERARL